jgi:hypothetical protein
MNIWMHEYFARLATALISVGRTLTPWSYPAYCKLNYYSYEKKLSCPCAWLIKHYAMKTYGEVDAQIHVFLTWALIGCERSDSRQDRFTPGEKSPCTHWIQKLGGFQNMSGRRKVAPTGTRTPTSRPMIYNTKFIYSMLDLKFLIRFCGLYTRVALKYPDVSE